MPTNTAESGTGGLIGRKVLMIIANTNFRDEELFTPLTILRNAGMEIKVAAKSMTPAKGMLGRTILPDLVLEQVKVAEYNLIVFIGGSGAAIYFHDPFAHQIAQETVVSGKHLGAICVAPAILANAGVLKGKKATSFPSEKPTLIRGGAIWQNDPIVKDGKIITAEGPRVADAFAMTLAEALQK